MWFFFFRNEAPLGLTQRQESPETYLSLWAIWLTDAALLTDRQRNHLSLLFTTTTPTLIHSVISDLHFHQPLAPLALCRHLLPSSFLQKSPLCDRSGWIKVSPIVTTYILHLIHRHEIFTQMMKTEGDWSTSGGRSGVSGWMCGWVSQKVLCKGLFRKKRQYRG